MHQSLVQNPRIRGEAMSTETTTNYYRDYPCEKCGGLVVVCRLGQKCTTCHNVELPRFEIRVPTGDRDIPAQ